MLLISRIPLRESNSFEFRMELSQTETITIFLGSFFFIFRFFRPLLIYAFLEGGGAREQDFCAVVSFFCSPPPPPHLSERSKRQCRQTAGVPFLFTREEEGDLHRRISRTEEVFILKKIRRRRHIITY